MKFTTEKLVDQINALICAEDPTLSVTKIYLDEERDLLITEFNTFTYSIYYVPLVDEIDEEEYAGFITETTDEQEDYGFVESDFHFYLGSDYTESELNTVISLAAKRILKISKTL